LKLLSAVFSILSGLSGALALTTALILALNMLIPNPVSALDAVCILFFLSHVMVFFARVVALHVGELPTLL
jgi:hypothetical protein